MNEITGGGKSKATVFQPGKEENGNRLGKRVRNS